MAKFIVRGMDDNFSPLKFEIEAPDIKAARKQAAELCSTVNGVHPMSDESESVSASAESPEQMAWLDRQFANTSIIVLFLAAFFCAAPILIIAIIELIIGKNPKARRNAMIIVLLDVVLIAAQVIYVVMTTSQP